MKLPARSLLSRRHVFALAGGAAATALLAACSDGSDGGAGSTSPPTGPATTTATTTGAPAPVATDVRSSNGRLAVTLVAAATQLPWGTGTRYALTYNGSVPGPTLRIRPGDVLEVTLRNELDRPTNLHTHGLHVSPSGDSDNIFVMVEPGQERTYRYEIPADHPSGTYWYHPHHHGLVASQLSGGMAGVIVIEDALDALPEMAATTERILVIADPRVGPDASVLDATSIDQMLGREGDVVTVNGALRPTLTATAGTVERWRLVNASASRYYRLTLAGASMHQIASDHGRLDAPLPITELLLTPGQRAEVLVPLTVAGTFTLSSSAVDRGGMGGMGMGGGMHRATNAGADLLTLEVTAPASAPAAPALPARLATLEPIAALVADGARTITLGAMGMGGGMGGGGMGAGMFVIDGKSFDGARVDTQVKLGTTEEWTLTNASMMDHPFHLHVWPFRVTSRSDGAALDPGWRDTVNVPAGGSVTVRLRFQDYGGTTVYHCHILDHEDLGMMGVIEAT